MQGLRLVQLIKPPPMYNLSELIKTDCCIDCGTNEKLREVVWKMNLPAGITQMHVGIWGIYKFIEIHSGKYSTYANQYFDNPIPLASINIVL